MSEETQDNEAEGGSGKVFLVLGLLLGVGMGGGGGYYYFGGSGDDASKAAAVAGVEEVAERTPAEELIPIVFERIAVPIYTVRGTSRRYVGNYFLDLHVNVVGQDDQILVKRSLSQLQHAFISAITKGDLMREDSRTELDIDKAAELLKNKAADVVGAGVVKSVTITKSMRIAN